MGCLDALCHNVWYSGCFQMFKLMLIMMRSCSKPTARPEPYVWSCFAIALSLVPLFWFCFTIEKNNTSPALKFDQDLAAIIILSPEKYQGRKQFDWLNFSYKVLTEFSSPAHFRKQDWNTEFTVLGLADLYALKLLLLWLIFLLIEKWSLSSRNHLLAGM